MRFGPAVKSLAAWFDAKKLFYSLLLLSLILVFTVVREHRDIMSTMDALASLTTVGVSFLVSPPQMQTQTQTVTVTPSYVEAASLGQGLDDSGYDWQRSTEENYRSDPLSQTSGDGFVGDFKKFRRRLDRSYHNDYVPARQALQDTIIRSLFETEHQEDEDRVDFPALLPARDKSCEETYPTNEKNKNNKNCPQDDAVLLPENEDFDEDDSRLATATATASDLDNNTPWIVFTAGVYGAGKSHTIQSLQDLGCFPTRSSFVGVDPDEIRRRLPEFSRYNTDRAGALTQKEAGMVAELLTDVALSSGKNVVVDGSLRDATWHEGYFRKLRSRFGNTHTPPQKPETDDENFRSKTGADTNLRIGILYVTAPADEIYQRVQQRGASTGRSVPPEFLERSMREVPGAIERLKPLADFFLHVHNSKENNDANANTNTNTNTDNQMGHRRGNAEDSNNNSINNSNSNNKGKVDLRLAKSSNERLGHLLRSEIEGIIFQEKCRSIVG